MKQTIIRVIIRAQHIAFTAHINQNPKPATQIKTGNRTQQDQPKALTLDHNNQRVRKKLLTTKFSNHPQE